MENKNETKIDITKIHLPEDPQDEMSCEGCQ